MLTDYVKNSINNHHMVSDSTLHVMAVVSNSARYHSRYRLAREFFARMHATPNVELHVVETAFGDRHHEVTGRSGLPHSNTSELQLRTSTEIWLKEAMINVGVRHLLPSDWRYVAWVDADVTFHNSNWALETIHALQHHCVVQPWSECIDTGPNGNALKMFRSFGSIAQSGERIQAKFDETYRYGHTGYAWACTRRFWENTHGLMDFPILGSSDHHMAFSLLGRVDDSVDSNLTEGYRQAAREWQNRAYRETNGHIGYVPGMLTHAFHGSKRNRYYRERRQILIEHAFDPNVDLRRDAQGLFYLVGKPALEEDIRRYMRSRNEDSIDEE